MNVEQALHARRSVRAFLPQSPDAALVRSLMEQSAQAASGGNLQPWRVLALTGEPLQQLLTAVAEAEPQDAQPGLSYPPNLWEPYRSRRFANGEELYQSLGIPRDDKPARLEQLARNGQFFGAPVGLIVAVDERMGLRALVRGVKEEAPAWAGTLPQLPRLVHHALTEATRHQSAQQQRLDELAASQRTQSRLLLVIGAVAMALLGLELYRLFG